MSGYFISLLLFCYLKIAFLCLVLFPKFDRHLSFLLLIKEGFQMSVLTLGVISSVSLHFTAEVKLTALKKASQGSTKLSTFTKRMTR